jgi:hypothetical protein
MYYICYNYAISIVSVHTVCVEVQIYFNIIYDLYHHYQHYHHTVNATDFYILVVNC